MAQIPQVIEAGFPTFKVFTTNIRPNTVDRMARLGHVAAVMEEVAASNGLMVVHAEDDDLVQFLYRRLKDQGTYDWTNMHKAHTNMSEDISFRRVIRAAEWTGAAVYFVHVSAKEGSRPSAKPVAKACRSMARRCTITSLLPLMTTRSPMA